MCIISIASGNIYFKFIRCLRNRELCTVAMFISISITTSDTEDTRVWSNLMPLSSGDVHPQSSGSRFLRSDSFGLSHYKAFRSRRQ